jgi:hypothetical protein
MQKASERDFSRADEFQPKIPALTAKKAATY